MRWAVVDNVQDLGVAVEGGRAETVIEPGKGRWFIDFREVAEYKDLFYFLVLRDIKVLYAQTILGFSWAVLQPLVQIVIFTVVFGKVAKVPTDSVPYVLFSSVAIVPWTYMAQSMAAASQSLVLGQGMLGKVYFPRIIFPLTPVLAKLVDFFIALVLLQGVILYYGVFPGWRLLLLPLFLALMVAFSAAVGFWTSAMAIRFRDVKHAMPFAVQMLMYTAPIVYSASSIPAPWRLLYSFNPIVSIIEGIRACLLGTALPWAYILPGAFTTALLLVGGIVYFTRFERVFVDVI